MREEISTLLDLRHKGRGEEVYVEGRIKQSVSF